jgi:glucokinase
VDDLILLTLGTGIGGGIVSSGKVLHGFVGMAGELGHMTVYPEGNPCACGNFGCLEKHASATAVTAMARMLGLGEHVSSKDVYDLAVSGNQQARVCFERMGLTLGIALGTLINIFNFPLCLLSGGMLPAWDLFAPAMLAEVKRRSLTYRNTSTRIEKATLGNEAGLYGAAYLPYQSRIIAPETTTA